MTIVEALKAEFTYVCVKNSDKFLGWNGSEWIVTKVNTKPPFKKKFVELYCGDSESDAVEVLMNG